MFGISILMLNAQTKLFFTHCKFFDQNTHKWNYRKKTSIKRSTHLLSYDPPFPRIRITLLYSHSIPLNTHPISTQLIFFFSDSSHSSPTLLVTHLSFFFSLIHHTSSSSHSSLIPKSYVILEQWPSKWWFSIILAGTRYAFIFFFHCRRGRRELLDLEWLNESKSFCRSRPNIFRFFQLLRAKHFFFGHSRPNIVNLFSQLGLNINIFSQNDAIEPL